MRAPLAPAAPRRAAPARRAALTLLAALGAGAGLAPAARAQTVTPRCSAFAAAGCAALRFDIAAAAGAPLALSAFDVQLGGGYAFATGAGGTRAAFTGEDAFTAGTPFTGSARVSGGRDLFVAFLESPGFTFELGPDETGYLEFALTGAGEQVVASYQVSDADGAPVADGSARVDAAPAAVVPEPATVALVAGGLLALAAGARRRGRA